jgi:two-component system sensor histidine kinase VanS
MRVKHKFFGIFGKVFIYTMLIFFVVIGGMFLFFSNQIISAVTATQQRQASEVFLPLFEQLQGKTREEIIVFAEEFHRNNESFIFSFINEDGDVLFQTDDFTMHSDNAGLFNGNMRLSGNALGNGRFLLSTGAAGSERIVFLTGNEDGLRLYVTSRFLGTSVYDEILERAAWVFGLIFVVSLISAFLFARRIAKPIQKVSADTRAMTLLLPVDPPKERGDEIGQLSRDVYAMYGRLKSTIGELEHEVEHVKQMEESQRYFFSAASHELKTPIAATGAIIEGMLSDVISPEEYPAYLLECMKLIGEQNKLVSEILELVKLGSGLPIQELEPINLRQCVDSVLETLSLLIESKAQQLSVEVAEDIVCILDSGLFIKALSNVLLNAAQNSPEAAYIHVVAKEENDYVRLAIWNSGVEIPEEILPKLYEPFHRADEARTSGGGRSGLGLVIVKKALDFMGIAFGIDNVDGGVMFHMDIPEKLSTSNIVP